MESPTQTFRFCACDCNTRSSRSTVFCAWGRADASLSLPRTAFTRRSYMSAAWPLLPDAPAPPAAVDDLPGPEVMSGAPLSSRTSTTSSSSRLRQRNTIVDTDRGQRRTADVTEGDFFTHSCHRRESFRMRRVPPSTYSIPSSDPLLVHPFLCSTCFFTFRYRLAWAAPSRSRHPERIEREGHRTSPAFRYWSLALPRTPTSVPTLLCKTARRARQSRNKHSA